MDATRGEEKAVPNNLCGVCNGDGSDKLYWALLEVDRGSTIGWIKDDCCGREDIGKDYEHTC